MAALPIALLGGAAMWVVPKINKAFEKDLKNPEDENTLHSDFKANLDEHGAFMGTWAALLQKQFLMGHPVSDVDGINDDKVERGYTPGDGSSSRIDKLNRQHQELLDFDRSDAMFALWTMRGEVRPYRRQGINTALSEELHHPGDPSRKTAFLATSYVPNYAHQAQIDQAKRVAASDDPERSLRRMNGVELYARAPFQSFRYSE